MRIIIKAIVAASVGLVSCEGFSAELIDGWWADEPITFNVNSSDFSFVDSWHIFLSGPSACALRYGRLGSNVSHVRVYRGAHQKGHLWLAKQEILLGTFADEPALARVVPRDPLHFFMGNSGLVMRAQLPEEKSSRFTVLHRIDAISSANTNFNNENYCKKRSNPSTGTSPLVNSNG